MIFAVSTISRLMLPSSHFSFPLPPIQVSVMINCFLIVEKLLLSSNKTEDYAFTVKGCPTADGIDDYEEFKATEVNYLFFVIVCTFYFLTHLSSLSMHYIQSLEH